MLLEIGVANGKTEVRDLDLAVCEEDVGGFEVAVDDAEAVDATITVDDLREDVDGLALGHLLVLLDEAGEVSSVAELGDDAGVGLEGDDFVELDDVLEVVEDLEDVDFVA